MLRYSFLPSDYNPMVLMLGDVPDIRALSDMLTIFARASRDIRLGTAKGFAPSDTVVTLTAPDDEQRGMRLLSGRGKTLRWMLDAPTAMAFAETIHELERPDLKSGSQKLLCGDYREIPVKVSRGEFTDDYLVFARLELVSG